MYKLLNVSELEDVLVGVWMASKRGEVIENQQDMPQRDLEMKMRQKWQMPKCNHLGIIYLQKPIQRNSGKYVK